MRILFLTSRLPYPPDRGDRLRAFNFIKRLSREHELTLISFASRESHDKHVIALKSYCRDIRVVPMGRLRPAATVLGNLWRREPLQALYYRSAAMKRLIDRTLAATPFDVAYVHLFRMAPYLAGQSDLYRIVDLTDVISLEVARSLPYRKLLWRLIYSFERPRMERYERLVTGMFNETWLISEADHKILAPSCPGANIRVISNGVDTKGSPPDDRPPQPNSLVFVGHLRVFHNVDAATHLVRDVLPLVWQQIPDCTLKIVGADPSPQVRKLGKHPAVEVTGFVPDLSSVLNQAAVFVAPLRFAAGIQNKVLEAMAAARPVITSSLVNAGLGARPEQELLIADDAEATAGQIVTLLQNRQLQMKIGQAAKRFVRQTYSWDGVAQRMGEIQQELTG